MEFVTPVSPRRLASALLLHLIETARAAGCTHLTFSAPPRWRHWKLLRAAGFLPVRSEILLLARGRGAGTRTTPHVAMGAWRHGRRVTTVPSSDIRNMREGERAMLLAAFYSSNLCDITLGAQYLPHFSDHQQVIQIAS